MGDSPSRMAPTHDDDAGHRSCFRWR